MSHPIQTSNLTPNTVRTEKNPDETTADWVQRHNTSVSKSTPSGNSLTTTWTSASGDQSKTTTRMPGESDAQFVVRHENAYMTLMIDQPPIP